MSHEILTYFWQKHKTWNEYVSQDKKTIIDGQHGWIDMKQKHARGVTHHDFYNDLSCSMN